MHVTLRPTERPEHASQLAAASLASDPEPGLIIAAGGDGTINEVANGMIAINTSVPLAILPAGTASVLAMEMRMGKDIVAAARQLPSMVPRRIAVGRFTPDQGKQRHFLLMAGAGLDASVASRVQPDVKRRFGKFAYWLAGFSAAGEALPQMEAEINGRRHTTGFALIARVRNYGGDLELARRVTLLEDTFETVLFEGKSTWPFTKYLTGAVLGRMNSMKGVTMDRCSSLTLRPLSAEPVAVQLDGELVGFLPAKIEIVPNALTLMTPADLESRYL
jgi:diacylglycerol kinase (ATP)